MINFILNERGKGVITTGSGDTHLWSLTLQSNPQSEKRHHAFLPHYNLVGSRLLLVFPLMSKQNSHRGRRDFTAQGPCKNRIKKQLLLPRVATRSSKKHQTQSQGLRRGPTSIYQCFPEKIKVWKRGGGDRETSRCLSTRPFLFVVPRK